MPMAHELFPPTSCERCFFFNYCDYQYGGNISTAVRPAAGPAVLQFVELITEYG